MKTRTTAFRKSFWSVAPTQEAKNYFHLTLDMLLAPDDTSNQDVTFVVYCARDGVVPQATYSERQSGGGRSEDLSEFEGE